MKKTSLAIIAIVALPLLADDSAVVKAAKASGGSKKKSTTKVITNEDVKKSAGTVKVLPASKNAAAPSSTVRPRSPLDKQEDERRAADAAAKKVATAETKVKGLESDLGRIEQSYYEASDLNYRDTIIRQKFDQMKKQLDDARKELADARDVQKRATTPKS
jgi:hypothetical protein